MPAGLRESDKLPEPIFTPATKAQIRPRREHLLRSRGPLIGRTLAGRLRDLTLAIYKRAASYAETRGIIIADTKFEFGFVGDELVLGDEVLDAGFLALLAARDLPARRRAAFLRQAVCARLSGIHPLEQAASRARAACRSD